ncbi:MAG: hypothetical protein NT105_13230 [Verrucomicrobia bacterium]|nr:hypothetical protein [Verrucomicrobiota bacterium]
MSLESFYHEVALRQASADRDNLKPAPPWWRRHLAVLPPTAKRLIAFATVTALAAVGWWLHPLTSQFLLDSPLHPPGAADVLAAVTHHASPVERAHRTVLACARENDAHACQEMLRQALTVARPHVVASWLKEEEVHALRINAYFEQFASSLENLPDRRSQPTIVSTGPATRLPQSGKFEPQTTGIASPNVDPSGGGTGHMSSAKPSPATPYRDAAASGKMKRLFSPEVPLDLSVAPLEATRARINQSPVASDKKDPLANPALERRD